MLPANTQREVYVVALHADTAQATLIDLPFISTSCRMEPFIGPQSLILAATPDGRLMVVVSENFVISAWTLEEEPSRSSLLASWSQQVLVDKKNWAFGIGDPTQLGSRASGRGVAFWSSLCVDPSSSSTSTPKRLPSSSN